jgi:hypothetical protein
MPMASVPPLCGAPDAPELALGPPHAARSARAITTTDTCRRLLPDNTMTPPLLVEANLRLER